MTNKNKKKNKNKIVKKTKKKSIKKKTKSDNVTLLNTGNKFDKFKKKIINTNMNKDFPSINFVE